MHGRRNPMPRRDPSFRDERLRDRRGKLSGTVYCPTLERTSPWSNSPRAPCAFDLSTIGSSCDSRSFSRFASVFLDRRAK